MIFISKNLSFAIFLLCLLNFTNAFAKASCSGMKRSGNLFASAMVTNSASNNIKFKLKVQTDNPKTETSTSWSNDFAGFKTLNKQYRYQGIAEMLINKNNSLANKSCSDVLGLVSNIWVVVKAVGSTNSKGKVNCDKATSVYNSDLKNMYSNDKYFNFMGDASGDLRKMKCYVDTLGVYFIDN